MKFEHIRKDWLFWVLALGTSLAVGIVGGIAFAFAMSYFANAPGDYASILGMVMGITFGLFTLTKFGIKISANQWPF